MAGNLPLQICTLPELLPVYALIKIAPLPTFDSSFFFNLDNPHYAFLTVLRRLLALYPFSEHFPVPSLSLHLHFSTWSHASDQNPNVRKCRSRGKTSENSNRTLCTYLVTKWVAVPCNPWKDALRNCNCNFTFLFRSIIRLDGGEILILSFFSGFLVFYFSIHCCTARKQPEKNLISIFWCNRSSSHEFCDIPFCWSDPTKIA